MKVDVMTRAALVKLLIRLFVLALCVALIVLPLSAMYLKSFQNKNSEYLAMPYDLEVVNTGSSHGARSFWYQDTAYAGKAFNLGMSSQSIQYDYNLLDAYADHLSPGAVVLVNLSYFTFWSDEMDSDSFDNKNLRYFGILDIDHMRMRSESDYLINKYASVINMPDRRIRSIFASRQSMEQGTSQDDVAVATARTEEDGRQRALYHMRSAYKDGQLLPVNEENIQSLDDILTLCRARGFKAVLITTPFMEIYDKWFPEDLRAQQTAVIDDFCARYDVPYLDYSADPRISPNRDFFMNEDHLNRDGAIAFTGIVLDELTARGLLPAHQAP